MAFLSSLRRYAGQFVGNQDSLRGKVVRSGSWIAIGYGVEMVLRLGSSLILTRLLSPAAFGIMATAQVFLYTAVMLSDVGIRSLVITHDRGHDPDFLRTVWTFQIVRGLILAVVVALLGQLLGLAQATGLVSASNSFAEPILPMMIAVLGVTLAFDGLKSTNEHIITRDLRQDVIVKLETGTKLAGTFITLAAVWYTASVWGFVYAALIVAMVRSALSLITVPGPNMRLHWDRTHIRYMIDRGKWIGVSSWTTLAGSLADKVLIGSFFGSQTLGVYTLAITLVDAVHALMTKIIGAVALPAIRDLLSRGHATFQRGYQTLRSLAQVVSSILGLALVCTGPFIVDTLYDDRYQLAGTFLAFLATKYFIFYLSLNRAVLEAKQEFRLLAGFNAIATFCLWLGAYTFAWSGKLHPLIILIALYPLIERFLMSFFLVRADVLNLKVESYSYLALSAFLVATLLLS